MRCGLGGAEAFLPMDVQLVQRHLRKRLSFPHWIAWAPSSKLMWAYWCVSISGSSALVPWPVSLSLAKTTPWITAAVSSALTPSSEIPPAVLCDSPHCVILSQDCFIYLQPADSHAGGCVFSNHIFLFSDAGVLAIGQNPWKSHKCNCSFAILQTHSSFLENMKRMLWKGQGEHRVFNFSFRNRQT